jgi:hypothetical protein
MLKWVCSVAGPALHLEDGGKKAGFSLWKK